MVTDEQRMTSWIKFIALMFFTFAGRKGDPGGE
jgi:hypothetical protein